MAKKVNFDFTLMSLNVKGMRNIKKRTSLLSWITKKNFDIVFLQETHSCNLTEQDWRNEWKGGRAYMSHGSSNSRGVMILFKHNLDFEVHKVISDEEGRYLIIECEIMDEPFVLVNVYAPNTEDKQVKFLCNLHQILLQHNFTNISQFIMGGDWNIVRNASVDKSGGTDLIKHKSIDKMDEIMNMFDLNDSWRIKYPNEKRYTWRQKSPLIQCRLDYWLISDVLFDNIAKIDTIPSIQTDHSAITLQLNHIDPGVRGPGLWKFNTSLLNNDDFKEQMKTKLAEWHASYDLEDTRIKWEIMKYEIRKFCISYSKSLKRRKNDLNKALKRELMGLDRIIRSDEENKRYHEIKAELLEHEKEHLEGLLVRSRTQWYEEGEKSTAYFFNLEKTNAVKKQILAAPPWGAPV